MTNLDRWVEHHNPANGMTNYRLPSGWWVTVIADPSRPLRWETLVLADDGTPFSGAGFDLGGVRAGMTSTEVEDLLSGLLSGLLSDSRSAANAAYAAGHRAVEAAR